jgi:hypothetical protein
MKLDRLALVIIILTALTFSTSAAEYNLIAGEPLGLFNNTFSGYYSKISVRNAHVVAFPLSYSEAVNVKYLSAGVEYRKYLSGNLAGLYFETNLAASLQDKAYDPDILTLTPAFVVGYRIDAGQGLFVEPELTYTLPMVSVGGTALEVAKDFESSFNIVLGLDNVYPNGIFFAPRLSFSYSGGTLHAVGKLFLGYGF